ncbi:Cytochrome c oxidase subunit 5A, mitochondrial [Tupaia chinensis]|uniref:Cytochrome c oxidase subunit 5A, mitochondrial n=1 Tax=Tupaia chinensis TaxID=246437 RepID=L9L0J7_TUPCH|nr:Cytochrome c oxidase subunit 5A, mitochondrial [Tupaia chinensis]
MEPRAGSLRQDSHLFSKPSVAQSLSTVLNADISLCPLNADSPNTRPLSPTNRSCCLNRNFPLFGFARRLNDFASAVRILEVVKDKAGPHKEIYPYVIQELRPTLNELGISTPEELGLDKA